MANMHQCWELTSEQKIYAKTYLNETDKIRKNVVAEIKRWLEKNKNFILQYLRICKFDIEETKIRIQNYHKLRSDISEWYANKDPFQPELQSILDLGMFFFLRKPDNQERSVFFTRPYLYDPKINKLSDVIKKYPENFISINCINTPGLANATLSLFKTFMDEDLEGKLHSFRTTEGSSNHIPTNTLPNEYGGWYNNWKKLVEENRNFIDDEKYKKYLFISYSLYISDANSYVQI
ncbi:hypothetical protein P5V15_005836 [Pogonomyrmex californicus]